MNAGGFAGRVLVVDLTDRTVKAVPLDMSLAERFGGGLGMCIALARDHLDPACDALGPGNVVVIGAGPLVGTDLPATSRVYAVAKLPGSKTVGWCGAGGMTFGCGLKNAGYDHVVIRGRADAPVYLRIDDDLVEVRDAGHLWGLGVGEACRFLQDRHGRHAGVISIGPAGENLVTFAMAYVDRISTLGRGGLGAVFGSKNLKAVVVTGTRGVRVADRNAYRELARGLIGKVRSYPYLGEWQELGLLKSLPVVPREVYLELRARRVACVSCPLGDKDMLRIPASGGGDDLVCSSSAVNLFMPLVHGMKDPLDAARCTACLDRHGLDMFEFFGLMGYVRTLQDAGIIPAGSEPVDVTSLSSMRSWAGRVSARQGIGNVVADGFMGMFREFGATAQALAPSTSRGMITYVGPKAALPWNLFGTMELGQALDPRGPHVGAGGSPTYFAKRELDVFPAHLRRMGVPDDAASRILQGMGTQSQGLKVGRLLRYSHRWFTILGSLGVCARAQVNRFYSAQLCADLFQAVTGMPTDLAALGLRADRAWTLLHLVNVRTGTDMADLPEKWFHEPGFRDYLTGAPLNRQDAQAMVADYYDEQGWDAETGIPLAGRLRELGLQG